MNTTSTLSNKAPEPEMTLSDLNHLFSKMNPKKMRDKIVLCKEHLESVSKSVEKNLNELPAGVGIVGGIRVIEDLKKFCDVCNKNL